MKHVPHLQFATLCLLLFAAAAPANATATITSAAPPGGGVGVYYNHTYTFSTSEHCNSRFKWGLSLRDGALPPGLSLSIDRYQRGHLSGTPTASGTYTGTVWAEYCLQRASQAFSIVIADTPPVFPAGGIDTPVGSVGAPYTVNITATGTTPISYKVTAGALPGGLALSAAGLVSGTPTAAGSFGATITAHNGILPDATTTVIFVIAGPEPHITSGALPDGSYGVPYTFSYTATGSTPISYSVTTGALPYGLSLSVAGVISGTPTASGTYTGTVMASNGISPDDTQDFSILIHDVPPAFTNAPPMGTVGTPYSFALTATGTQPISYSVTAGALPDGLTLSPAGVIAGTPTTEEVSYATITATNGTAPDAVTTWGIQIILLGPPVITSMPPPDGPAGNPYTFTYTASGATAGYINYSVTRGALPPGLSLSADGILSGTPTTVNTYTGTVTASSGVAPDATQDFSITIAAAPPVITSGMQPHGTVGTSYAFSYTAMGSMPMAYSVTAGALPGGLTLSADGLISGTPTATGMFVGTVTVSNGVLPNATQEFNINVQGTPVPAGGESSSGGGGGGALDGLTLLALLLSLLAAGRWQAAPRHDCR